MLTLNRRTVTLDITSTEINLLSVKGRRVVRWASAPLEPGLVQNGLVLDPTALGRKVKRLMKASDIQSKKIVASVSGLFSTCRLLRLPLLSGEQLTQEPVMQAAEAILPVPMEGLYVSWQPIGDICNNGTGPLALVVGTPQSIIDVEMTALRSAGVRPSILNLKIMALIRLIPRQNALIINMETDSLDIAIIVNGIPQIMRTVALPPSMSIAGRVESVTRNLEQTVSFYNARHSGDPIEYDWPLSLAGGWVDHSPDAVRMVQSIVPYPLTPLVMPLEYPENLPICEYAVNIGLAVGQISVPEVVGMDEPVPDRMETGE
ncbi:type IV pilus biogenesis protein PilM [Chloroflexota bacterium]